MKTSFFSGATRYVPGQVYGRESYRGWGRSIKRTMHREWTRWTYSDEHRAWIHAGKTWAKIRATKKQIIGGDET